MNETKQIPMANYSKRKKINIKIIMIMFIIILVLFLILYYFLIYNSFSSKLKRTLIEEGYNCQKKICSKKENQIQYTINCQDNTYQITTKDYFLTLSERNPVLEIRQNDYLCHYETTTSQDLIDKNNVTESVCQKYIVDINKMILYRNKITNQAKE